MGRIHIIPLLVLISLSCSKRNFEPEVTPELTNEMVGTSWSRLLAKDIEINKDMYLYLDFKNASDVEFSSRYDKDTFSAASQTYKYTYNDKKVVYRTGDRLIYEGVVSGDTLTVLGHLGYVKYLKVK